MSKTFPGLFLLAFVLALSSTNVRGIPVKISMENGGLPLNGAEAANRSRYEPLTEANHDCSPTVNLAFLIAEVAPADLASVNSAGLVNLENLGGSTFLPTRNGLFDYILFHFGAPQAGQQGRWQAFSLGSAAVRTLAHTGPISVGGIHWGSTPRPGFPARALLFQMVHPPYSFWVQR